MNGWIAEGSYFIIHRHGPLAQWLEQATHNRLVAGSSPAGATRHIKDLDEKSSKSFFFASDLDLGMGKSSYRAGSSTGGLAHKWL